MDEWDLCVTFSWKLKDDIKNNHKLLDNIKVFLDIKKRLP